MVQPALQQSCAKVQLSRFSLSPSQISNWLKNYDQNEGLPGMSGYAYAYATSGRYTGSSKKSPQPLANRHLEQADQEPAFSSHPGNTSLTQPPPELLGTLTNPKLPANNTPPLLGALLASQAPSLARLLLCETCLLSDFATSWPPSQPGCRGGRALALTCPFLGFLIT